MLHNYLKIALRNLRKRPGYTFLNVTGLAVGLACCLLIGLYVADELRYDRHITDPDLVVRATTRFGDRAVLTTPSMLAPSLRRSMPEVMATTRLYDVSTFSPVVVARGDTRFQEGAFFYGDSTTFDVLDLQFVAGRPESALARSETIVLTRSTAEKYFGDEDPIGQTLTVDARRTFEVTGVVEDLPHTTHLRFDFLASLVTLAGWSQLDDEELQAANFLTYVRLRPGADLGDFEAKVTEMIDAMLGPVMDQQDVTIGVDFQRLTDIHLYYDGYITYVYLFGAIAALILLIAVVNFMNLATARSAERAKEVGVRKAVGAGRRGLVGQFLAESVLLSLVATGLALLLAELVLPLFRDLSAKPIAGGVLLDPLVVFLLLGFGLFVGLLAGAYPAFVLSAFRPTDVLKGAFAASSKGRHLRQVLVVGQFAIVVFLLVAMLVIERQLDFVQTTNLGFDREQIVVLPTGDRTIKSRFATLKQEVEVLPGVVRAAGISSLPGDMRGGYSIGREGSEASLMTVGVQVDPDGLATLGIELVAGQDLPDSPTYSTDDGYVYLINETTAAGLGWTPEEAVGQVLNLHGREGEVVGVMKNFHFASLHTAISPLTMWRSPGDYDHLMVKIAPGDPRGVIDGLERVYGRLAPHRPFEYDFLDRQYDALYATERRMATAATIFAGLAVFVACLGLFGLASFTAEQRTKEIGVRKVLGASVPGIVLLLSRSYVKLIAIAIAIAAPLVYLTMQAWLAQFAYQTTLSPVLFVIAAALTVGVALATVSYQAIRAATANPVDALRYE